jgi:succinate-semialdehyde dehydrogenase / glutarate-semialdehyde dehydrogenase
VLQLKDSSLLRSQAYIAGQWVGADSGLTSEVLNPAVCGDINSAQRSAVR